MKNIVGRTSDIPELSGLFMEDFGQLGEIFCLRNTTQCVVLRKQNIIIELLV